MMSLLCTAIGCAHLLAQNTDDSPNIQLLVETGIEFGDEEIMRISFPNGDALPLDAGFGGSLLVGGQIKFNSVENLFFRGSIGLKYNRVATMNSYVGLIRFPITAMAYWKLVDDVRFGVGATSHLGVRFQGNDFLPNKDYRSSTGPRFEVGYKWIAITYTVLKYTDDAAEQFRGDSFGIMFSFLIPNKG